MNTKEDIVSEAAKRAYPDTGLYPEAIVNLARDAFDKGFAEGRKTQGHSEGDLRPLVRVLAAELRAARATIADAKHYLETERWDDPNFDPVAILSCADTSALAAHDSKVSERAWDKGYRRGREDHCDWWGGPDECDVSTPNPYRASIEQSGVDRG